ncbi:MAG: APC family permease [Proteobacteria bacterium]|nr:APC family permease [Pseudomonadota bacterium]
MPPAAAENRPPDPALVRAVGIWGLAASIVNITIAGSILVLPGTLGSMLGAAAPLAFLLGAALFVPLMLCFAAAGSRVAASGGPFSYVDTAFGRFPGFVVAALLWISSASGSGGIAAALADQLAQVLPELSRPMLRAALLLVLYGTLIAVNAAGIRTGTAANKLFALAKMLPLALIVVLAARYCKPSNLHIESWPAARALGTAMILVVFAYSGVETALAPSGEIRDNDRVVPRAVALGVGIVVGLYIAIQITCQGVLGGSLAGHAAPISAVAERVMPGGGTLVAALAGISLFGCLQGDLLGTSRLLYALAQARLLPAALASIRPSTRVPLAALTLHAACACGLAIVGSFSALALVSGGAFCFVYIGCAAAAWALQRRDYRQTRAPLVLPGGILIPAAGIAGFAALLSSLKLREWLAILAALAVICAWYAVAQRLFGVPRNPPSENQS